MQGREHHLLKKCFISGIAQITYHPPWPPCSGLFGDPCQTGAICQIFIDTIFFRYGYFKTNLDISAYRYIEHPYCFHLVQTQKGIQQKTSRSTFFILWIVCNVGARERGRRRKGSVFPRQDTTLPSRYSHIGREKKSRNSHIVQGN